MINRVVLVGRLTKDVEVRKTNTGISVASFTLACDRRGSKDANGQSTADFINCTAWRQAADFLGQYAKKGAIVGVDGRIQTSSYDDKEGRRVYRTDVVCDEVRLLESRRQSEARSEQSNMGYTQSIPTYDSYENSPITSEDLETGPSLDISSDDLPF